MFTDEQIIEAFSWVIAIFLLFLLVPLNEWRKASVAFSFMQLLTWMAGFWVVQYGWLEYPDRFFSNATQASVTFEFFVYPIVAVIFVVRYPMKHKMLIKGGYAFIFPTIITIAEVYLERYTTVIIYHQWKWYWSWITILAGLLFTFYYCQWFFSTLKKEGVK